MYSSSSLSCRLTAVHLNMELLPFNWMLHRDFDASGFMYHVRTFVVGHTFGGRNPSLIEDELLTAVLLGLIEWHSG